MKKERAILSFIAIGIGLMFAGIAFYLYQGTKTIPSNSKTVAIEKPVPTPEKSSLFLTVNEPDDEKVYNKKVINVSGKTIADAVVIILTDSDQEVIRPTKTGEFSTTMTIEDGENNLEITAIAPNGEDKIVRQTVTYSTEEF